MIEKLRKIYQFINHCFQDDQCKAAWEYDVDNTCSVLDVM